MWELLHKPGGKYLIYLWIYAVWLCLLFLLTNGLTNENWFEDWRRWDTAHYNLIVTEGYTVEASHRFAFPPGYPMFIEYLRRPFSLDFSTAAQLFNITIFWLGIAAITEVMVRLFGVSRFFFYALSLTSPTAYFAVAPYTESLFILILWSAIYLALLHPHSKKARIAELALLTLAPWIRVTGYSLLSWLLLRRTAAVGILYTLAIWASINYSIMGTPFYFVDAQLLFGMNKGWLLDGLIGAKDGVYNRFFGVVPLDNAMGNIQFSLMPVGYFFLLSIVALWFAVKRQYLIAITILSILAISHNQSFWRSVVRYDLPLMPCIWVPLLCMFHKAKGYMRAAILVLILSFAAYQFSYQIVYAREFAKGHWGF